jgi:hypothetical protein
MEEIAEILKGTINNLSGRTLNANLLLIQIVELKKTEDFQKCLKTDPDLTKAIADFEKRQNAYVVSGGYEQITVRNKKSVDSIYRLIKDPNLSATEKAEAIFKDPVLLMTAGVLFLFGVINPFGKNTDSFLKRLGWVLG